MKSRTRWILIGAALVVVAVVIVTQWRGGGTTVEAATVSREALREIVAEEGYTRIRARYAVAAPVAGKLGRIDLEPGDWVKAGQAVATLYPMPEGTRDLAATRAQLQAAEAGVSEATAMVEQYAAQSTQLSREAERTRALAEAGAVSRQARERDEVAALTAARQLEAARASLTAANAELARSRSALVGADVRAERAGSGGALVGTNGRGRGAVNVIAPVSGRVLQVMEQSERSVMAGTPLLELGDTHGLEAVVEVLSEDAVRLSAGNPASLVGWGGPTPLTGRVRLVEPDAFTKLSALGVEEQRVRVIVDIDSAPAALGSGFRVEARLVSWEAPDVLTVPMSALFQRDGEWQLFAIMDGRAALKTVTIGRRNAERAELLSGLVEGDSVVVFPSADVKDGVRVKVGEG